METEQITALEILPTHALYIHFLPVERQVPSDKITTRHRCHWVIGDEMLRRLFHGVETTRFDPGQYKSGL